MVLNKKVYLASPWFKPETAERQSRICQYMTEKGFIVFNPRKNIVTTDSTKDAQTNAFLGNLKAINDADVIVAITDGKDMGTIWESGYAFARKKPIIYYTETLGNNQFNLMLAKSGVAVCRNELELKIALRSEKTYKVKDTYDAYQGEIE
jgi:nucleoside 2-deoxyribosyltransferase